MWDRRRGSRIACVIVALLILISGLVACAEPLVEVETEPVASPASPVLAVGRLASGEMSAGLSLVGTHASEWTIQASVSLPEAAGVDWVAMVITRSDQPGVEQNIVQQVMEVSPVMLSLTLPDVADSESVHTRVDVQRGDDLISLGYVELELSSDQWHVVELVSGGSSGGGNDVASEIAVASEVANASEAAPATEPAQATSHAGEGEATPPAEPLISKTATSVPIHPTGTAPQPTPAPTATSTPASAYVVRIREPVNDEYVVESVTVRGEALAFENLVTVQMLDSVGSVLGQQQVLAQAAPGEAGPFEVIVQFPQVRLSQYGFVHAYVTSPLDGTIAAETSVRVNLHGSHRLPTPRPKLPQITPESAPALVEIIEPPDGAVVRGSVIVRGNGRAFENSLVVQVREFSGRVLGESVAQIDAGLGQVGSWKAQVQVTGLVVARQGQIYVYATNPEDGSVQADDRVEVWLAGSQ